MTFLLKNYFLDSLFYYFNDFRLVIASKTIRHRKPVFLTKIILTPVSLRNFNI